MRRAMPGRTDRLLGAGSPTDPAGSSWDERQQRGKAVRQTRIGKTSVARRTLGYSDQAIWTRSTNTILARGANLSQLRGRIYDCA